MNDNDRATVLNLYDDEEVSERAARELLGDVAFKDAQDKARGAEMMLSGDTSRFLTEETEG